jgi:hypothetical protein
MLNNFKLDINTPRSRTIVSYGACTVFAGAAPLFNNAK